MVASRSALLLTLTVGILSLTGCRICTNCEDEAYPTYGGIWQRTDRFHGRVGSIFAPAGAKIDRGSSVFSDQLMPDESLDDGEIADGGDEEEFETLPPGYHDSDADRSLDDELPPEEDATDLGDAEPEEVRLQQPLGAPGNYVDF